LDGVVLTLEQAFRRAIFTFDGLEIAMGDASYVSGLERQRDLPRDAKRFGCLNAAGDKSDRRASGRPPVP
jgi:hypothetical protein